MEPLQVACMPQVYLHPLHLKKFHQFDERVLIGMSPSDSPDLSTVRESCVGAHEPAQPERNLGQGHVCTRTFLSQKELVLLESESVRRDLRN